jgi:hypothetical protein
VSNCLNSLLHIMYNKEYHKSTIAYQKSLNMLSTANVCRLIFAAGISFLQLNCSSAGVKESGRVLGVGVGLFMFIIILVWSIALAGLLMLTCIDLGSAMCDNGDIADRTQGAEDRQGDRGEARCGVDRLHVHLADSDGGDYVIE